MAGLQFDIIIFYQTEENRLLFVCTETTEFKPAKLETNRTVIHSPTVCVLHGHAGAVCGTGVLICPRMQCDQIGRFVELWATIILPKWSSL